ncbi:MAG: hypothetical protein HY063_14685 [Bacteroidetes bacterium]|nr:hypothetical protein [Bacteroidota bacterium]
MDSKDSLQQDILITKSATVQLLAHETKTYDIFGMCCQAHNHSPDSGSVFRVGKMADSNLVTMARFIDKNNLQKSSVAQNAVWVLSDGNPMESIGGDDPLSKKIQQLIAKLTGKSLPKYKTEYKQSDNGIAFYSHPAKISGTFEYDMFTNGLATFGIYDSQGHAVEMFFTDVPRDKGFYIFNYEFKTSNLPAGEYYARLRLDGQVKKEQKFTF